MFNQIITLKNYEFFLLQILTVTPLTICEVPERKLSFIYNLTKLSSDKGDVIIEHDHETIRMQLCSKLIKKCNNQDGYAICLIKNNTEKGIGNAVQLKLN